MIVYGDPGFEATAERLLSGLKTRLIAVGAGQPESEGLRAALIEAGQVEQALWDEAESAGSARAPELVDAARQAANATDLVAAEMVARSADPDLGLAGPVTGPIRRARDAVDRAARALRGCSSIRLRVKRPEGYAFYALYPEQYRCAAEDWDRDHAPFRPGPVVVVGVRSIGTGLSALVAAVLQAAGWDVSRTTLRPRGHPFHREVAGVVPVRGAAFGVIVDEGPGLSGSSMAAAAEAAVAAGLDSSRVAFFCGHGRGPGPEADERSLRWWRSVRCYVPESHRVRPEGKPVLESLRERTGRVLHGEVEGEVTDLGGGAWRAAVWDDEVAWPLVCAPLERPKYRWSGVDGRAVLWKFAGIAPGPDGRTGAEVERDRLVRLAAAGWTPEPIDSRLGFVATPWIGGSRLTADDADGNLVASIGRYVVAAASCVEEELTPDEARAGAARLAEMIRVNSSAALGDEWQGMAARWGEAGERLVRNGSVPAYGDGRLAPHEWVRSGDGRLLKLDAGGHDADHTLIGRQPVGWDVAGAMVEWGLSPETARPMLDIVAAMGGADLRPAVLAYHTAAYAAFRVGLCHLALRTLVAQDSERARIERAQARYAAMLRRALATPPP